MAETLSFNIALGQAQAGLTLKAQLVDVNGVNTGSPITTGFTDIGLGNFYWVNSFADNFQGGVKFLNNADSTLKAFVSVMPNKLSPNGLDAITIESGVNCKQALQICASALAGVLSGAGTTAITIKAIGNSGTTRIVATVDANGNRSSVTLTP